MSSFHLALLPLHKVVLHKSTFTPLSLYTIKPYENVGALCISLVNEVIATYEHICSFSSRHYQNMHHQLLLIKGWTVSSNDDKIYLSKFKCFYSHDVKEIDEKSTFGIPQASQRVDACICKGVR